MRTLGIVAQSYKNHISSGLGYGDLTELRKVSGTSTDVKYIQNFQQFRVSWHRRKDLTEVASGYKRCCNRTPGNVATGLLNFRKFRVQV